MLPLEKPSTDPQKDPEASSKTQSPLRLVGTFKPAVPKKKKKNKKKKKGTLPESTEPALTPDLLTRETLEEAIVLHDCNEDRPFSLSTKTQKYGIFSSYMPVRGEQINTWLQSNKIKGYHAPTTLREVKESLIEAGRIKRPGHATLEDVLQTMRNELERSGGKPPTGNGRIKCKNLTPWASWIGIRKALYEERIIGLPADINSLSDLVALADPGFAEKTELDEDEDIKVVYFKSVQALEENRQILSLAKSGSCGKACDPRLSGYFAALEQRERTEIRLYGRKPLELMATFFIASASGKIAGNLRLLRAERDIRQLEAMGRGYDIPEPL